MKITIYILELERGYYYVGSTKNLDLRLKQHLNGKGSEWTKMNKVKRVYKTYDFVINSKLERDNLENHFTIELMKAKDWFKVRGGYFCNINSILNLKNLHSHGYFKEIQRDETLKRKVIFVLMLENEKFFIGKSVDFNKSLKKHQNGKASKWTKLHRPIKVVETIELGQENHTEIQNRIDELVQQYFKKFGFENVRGGRYSIIDTLMHLKKVRKDNKL
ncbi:GIY-YIG nuclease family protein [Christiangramia sp. ASW11-125]|uniref:GIY-YIG nuclease family protein n=1 Tax=Christiangramia sp. ASW11-125 TaxID=3400701 RepID=UPI003AAD779A